MSENTVIIRSTYVAMVLFIILCILQYVVRYWTQAAISTVFIFIAGIQTSPGLAVARVGAILVYAIYLVYFHGDNLWYMKAWTDSRDGYYRRSRYQAVASKDWLYYTRMERGMIALSVVTLIVITVGLFEVMRVLIRKRTEDAAPAYSGDEPAAAPQIVNVYSTSPQPYYQPANVQPQPYYPGAPPPYQAYPQPAYQQPAYQQPAYPQPAYTPQAQGEAPQYQQPQVRAYSPPQYAQAGPGAIPRQ